VSDPIQCSSESRTTVASNCQILTSLLDYLWSTICNAALIPAQHVARNKSVIVLSFNVLSRILSAPIVVGYAMSTRRPSTKLKIVYWFSWLVSLAHKDINCCHETYQASVVLLHIFHLLKPFQWNACCPLHNSTSTQYNWRSHYVTGVRITLMLAKYLQWWNQNSKGKIKTKTVT